MKFLRIGLFVLGMLVLGAGIYRYVRPNTMSDNCELLTISAGNTNITAEVANTSTERAMGLSNRDFLSPKSGMLFLFPLPGKHAFWMKDTRIPLDIIWLKNNQVIDLVTLHPQNGDTIPQHTPKSDADAVLEINVGEAQALGIVEGTTIAWHQCDTLVGE